MPQRFGRKSSRIQRKRRRGFSWRRLSEAGKIKKALRRIFAALGLFLIALFLVFGFYLRNYFKSPFANASGTLLKNEAWDQSYPLNLGLILIEDLGSENSKIDSLAVLHLDPDLKKYVLVEVEEKAVVMLPFGMGEHPLFEAYALGSRAEPKLSVALTLRALEAYLKVPISGYLLVDEAGLGEILAVTGKIDPNNLSGVFSLKLVPRIGDIFPLLQKNLRTDLSFGELFFVAKSLALAGEKGRLFYKKGSAGWEKDFEDERLLTEGEKIIVLNGAGKIGLAGFGARLVENLGGRVVFVANAPKTFDTSFIVSDNPDSYTARVLGTYFGISELSSKDDFAASNLPVDRADVIVVLGLDKAGYWW